MEVVSDSSKHGYLFIGGEQNFLRNAVLQTSKNNRMLKKPTKTPKGEIEVRKSNIRIEIPVIEIRKSMRLSIIVAVATRGTVDIMPHRLLYPFRPF